MLSGHRPPRYGDVDSFPTRRSSDLVDVAKDLVRQQALGGQEGFAPAEKLMELVARDPQSDRKSTRLNSSHVAISYAVFCLKKKNIQQEYDTNHFVSSHEARENSMRG